MEAGFARMNDLTVLQATQVRLLSRLSSFHSACWIGLLSSFLLSDQGLCAYMLRQDPEAATKGVVIGHVSPYSLFHAEIESPGLI
jgi:hypothetical protein